MIPISDLIRRMSQAGAPPEAIAIAVEAIELSQKELKEKRAKHAADEKRSRARRQSHDISLTSEVNQNASELNQKKDGVPLKEKVSPTPPLKENNPSQENSLTSFARARSIRKIPLPDDFTLTVADHEFARNRGWDADRRKSEFERFCDHAKAGGRLLVDWHAGWRTWVQSPYSSPVKPNGGKGGQRKTTSELCDEIADELRAKMRPADDPRRGGNGRQADAFGLSGDSGGLFEGILDEPRGNVVPISVGGGNGGVLPGARSAEAVQVLPPERRTGR